MDFVVRVVKGPDKGMEQPLKAGGTLIGRGTKAVMRLTAPNISWEHAVLTRSGDEVTLENLSAYGTYYDENKISGAMRLKPRDQFRLSPETVLRLEATGGGGGRLWLVLTIFIVVGVMGVAVAMVGLGGPTEVNDWNHAYLVLSPWVADEVNAKQLDPQTYVMFREAWRLESALDYKASSTYWWNLHLLLAKQQWGDGRDAATVGNSEKEQYALVRMLKWKATDPAATDDDKLAALVQFVDRRMAYAGKLAADKEQ